MIGYEGNSELGFEGARKRSSRSRRRKRTSRKSRPKSTTKKSRRSRRRPKSSKSLETLFSDMKLRSPHARTIRRSVNRVESPQFLFEGMGMPPQAGRSSRRSRRLTKRPRSASRKGRRRSSKRRKSKPFFKPLKFF